MNTSFQLISFEDSEQWDKIVYSFPDHDIYYLHGYLSAFQIHGDGTPILLYYQKKGLRCLCTFMIRDIATEEWAKDEIPTNTFFDAVTPYGYGGWLTDGNITQENIQLFWDEYKQFMSSHNIIAAFTRWCPWLQNQEDFNDLSAVIKLGNTISIDTSSEELIMENIKRRVRTKIRKAMKDGVQIEYSDDPQLLTTFREIYNKTMDKDNATPYYYFEPEFYDSMAKDIKGKWKFFYAVYEGNIIAMSIILFCNGKIHYHLSGSLSEYKDLNATNLILYQVSIYGAQNGYQFFHLGGGLGSSEDSLYRFKKALNKNGDKQFCISKDCFDKEQYNHLVNLRKAKDPTFNENGTFFPLYRG